MKYRIIRKNGLYYQQQKTLLFFWDFIRYYNRELECDITYDNGLRKYSFQTLEDAQNFLDLFSEKVYNYEK